MKIEAVDFFYVSMPEVTTDADGSQDALVVRVAAGGLVGWGECEASPLVSIAAFITPMSHGACRPVAATVAYNSMDLLQAAHTWSGIEMALWDLLGKARGEPAWRLLGYDRATPKTPYASQLFGDDPAETWARGKAARAGLRGGEVRLGTGGRDARGRQRAFRRRTRRARARRDPARRCRPDLGRGCRCGGRAAAGTRSRARDLARGAVPR